MNTAFKEDNVRPFVGINWSLENVATEARRGLEIVAEGEERSFEGWLIYGEALNEGRRMFPKGDNARFSEWLSTNNLSVANDAERAAAMWAAENREELAALQVKYPKVRTIRGLHAKTKQKVKRSAPANAPEKPSATVKPKLPSDKVERVQKLKAQLADPNLNQNIRENVQKKLDALADEYEFDTSIPRTLTHNDRIEELIKVAFKTRHVERAMGLMRMALTTAYPKESEEFEFLFEVAMKEMTK